MIIFGYDNEINRGLTGSKFSPPHLNSKNKKIEDINSKYLYYVNVQTMDFWTLEEYKHIEFNKQVIKDIQNSKAKLFVSYTFESLANEDPIPLLNSWISKYKFPHNSIILVSGNYSFGDSLKNHRYIKYIYHGLWEQIYYNNMFNFFYPDGFLTNPIINKKQRDKVFLCYNRRPKFHRATFVNELYKNDLLKYGYVSLNGQSKNHPEVHKWVTSDLFNMLPMTFGGTDLDTDQVFRMIEEDFQNSYVSIVTESTVDNKQIFATEKIFKPIMMLHPFMVLSNPGYLKHLKIMGYKTFSKWFDESYDLELDLSKRIDIIIKETKRLTKMSHDQLQNILCDMMPTLEYNLNNLITRCTNGEIQKQMEVEIWK